MFQPDNFVVSQVRVEEHETALDVLKQHYLPTHVLVRARNMDLSGDQALDEYLVGLLKQGLYVSLTGSFIRYKATNQMLHILKVFL